MKKSTEDDCERFAEDDAINKAFRHYKLDPNEPGAEKKLLRLMAQEQFSSKCRGRPKGTSKHDGGWYFQLVQDVEQIHRHHGEITSATETAALLKERFPERYGMKGVSWLRQVLGFRPLPLPTKEDLIRGGMDQRIVNSIFGKMREICAEEGSIPPERADALATLFTIFLIPEELTLLSSASELLDEWLRDFVKSPPAV